jgi:ATP-binding cassette subfamily A (ABC1) protein 3
MQWLRSESYMPQTVDFVPFPTTAYQSNGFYTVASQMFAFFFTISFLFPVSRLIRGLVAEKEMKIREGMRMMGLSDSALFGSWLVTYALIYLFIAAAIAIITSNNIFKASSGFLVFIFFWLFGLSTVTYCYFVSVFFSRAKTASTLGVVLFLASFFPWFAVADASYSSAAKIASSLLSTTAFGMALDQLAAYEDEGQGVNFSNAQVYVRNYSMSAALGMMFFDFLLYGVLAWYADAVLPASFREFGVARPWYFPFTGAYWREVCNCIRPPAHHTAPHVATPLLSASKRQTPNTSIELPGGHPTTAVNNMRQSDPHLFEAPDAARKAKEKEDRVVTVRGLSKVFSTPDGPKTAVDRIDMTMYEGDIFVLLGHNGAGKTTTINMLTGMLEPSSGAMSVFGRDVSHDLTAIRKDMGVCPQHDVLWPELTVKEHLRLYADIKGIPYAKITEEIERAVKTVGLTEKMNVQSGKLSGGQKRKLSVCIALLGGSKVIFLDEPTSGMDPYSRRSTWQILQNAREGRVMVLTTHFMDEADLLGRFILY